MASNAKNEMDANRPAGKSPVAPPPAVAVSPGNPAPVLPPPGGDIAEVAAVPPAGASAGGAPSAPATSTGRAEQEDWDETQRIADLAVERQLIEPSQLRFMQKLHSDLQSAGSHKSLYQVLEASKILDLATLKSLREEVRKSKPQRLGDYELLAQLGHGNTGQVYRAKHVQKGYEAALRVLSPALVSDKPFLEKFLKSAREAARLDHPHLVRTLEVGDAQGTYFLVSALVEGETLEQSVADHGPLQPLEALQIAEHLLLALAYLHKEGVQHFNIRPENIMLDSTNKTARLTDTGHVKPPMRRDKQAGNAGDAAANRPTYAAPEQIFASMPGDGRADLYSLGACLYFALTGQAPLTSMELARLSTDRGPVLDVCKVREDVPVAAAEFTQWLMGWSPDKRPASAQEALKKLVHILAQLKTRLKKSSRVDVTASVDRVQREAAAPPPPSLEKRRKSRRLPSSVAQRNRTTVVAEPDENPVNAGRAGSVILPKYVLFAIAVAIGMALGGMLAAIIVLLRH